MKFSTVYALVSDMRKVYLKEESEFKSFEKIKFMWGDTEIIPKDVGYDFTKYDKKTYHFPGFRAGENITLTIQPDADKYLKELLGL